MELQRKASHVGFDWNDPRAVLHKIREEADEIEAALDRGDANELADDLQHPTNEQTRVACNRRFDALIVSALRAVGEFRRLDRCAEHRLRRERIQ